MKNGSQEFSPSRPPRKFGRGQDHNEGGTLAFPYLQPVAIILDDAHYLPDDQDFSPPE